MAKLIAAKKLPKRAQREIDRLTAQAEHWKAQALAVASADPNATNVVLYGNVAGPDHGLPPNSTIRFRVAGEWFDVRVEDDALTVRAIGGMLAVLPAVSNVIHIVPRSR